MRINLYQSMYRSKAKYEAQDQLAGRTHYADDSTLKFFHAKILECDTAADGMLFWLIESVAADMNNTRRVFRPVVFDVFGNVVLSVDLENGFKTSKAAKKHLKEELSKLDALKITKEGLKRVKKNTVYEIQSFKKTLAELQQKKAG